MFVHCFGERINIYEERKEYVLISESRALSVIHVRGIGVKRENTIHSTKKKKI